MQDPIPPGGNFTYRFSTPSEYGFFWYHSHFRAYYNDAIRGPFLIRPSSSRQRPFESLARNDDDIAALLEAEKQATNILLNDWTHDLSDVIFARYLKTGAFPSCVDSILANGMGRVECLPEHLLRAGPGLGLQPDSSSQMSSTTGVPGMSQGQTMDMFREQGMHEMTMDMPMSASVSKSSDSAMRPSSTMTHSPASTDMPGMGMLSPRGCMPPMMFKPGFNLSSLPPDTCTNTSSEQLVVQANQTTGWLALNLVNSGAVSALSVSLDGHSMFVYAADGLYVALQKVQVQLNSQLYNLDHTDFLGSSHGAGPTVFSHDQAGPNPWELLSEICDLPQR